MVSSQANRVNPHGWRVSSRDLDAEKPPELHIFNEMFTVDSWALGPKRGSKFMLGWPFDCETLEAQAERRPSQIMLMSVRTITASWCASVHACTTRRFLRVSFVAGSTVTGSITIPSVKFFVQASQLASGCCGLAATC